MAEIVLGGVERIFKAVMAIKKAAETVRQNKKECQEIERRVARVGALLSLSHLQETDIMKNPTMSGPYDDLADSLEEALELIVHCQEKKALLRFLAAGDMAKQLRWVGEDIQLKLMVAIFATAMLNLEITNNMQNLLITMTMTLTKTIEYSGAHPLLTQSQDAGVSMIDQLATGNDRSEINSDITMVPTTSMGSGFTEVNLPEWKATMHQISEENISGGGGHSVIVKQKIVIKLSMSSDRYRSKAMALAAQVVGAESVALAGVDVDQLVVVGSGLDAIDLVARLRRKLRSSAHLVEVTEPKTEAKSSAVMVNTQEAQPAYEPANVRRRSGIRSVITKFTKFMRPQDLRGISRPQAAHRAYIQLAGGCVDGPGLPDFDAQ